MTNCKDDKSKRYKLTKEEAIEMLPDKEHIHTFRNSSIALIGADWSREDMLEMIEKHEFELSGENATEKGHGMAFMDELGWVFVETKK